MLDEAAVATGSAGSLGQALVALSTLTALEIVLGVDNVVFITIIVDRMDKARQDFVRRLGLLMAMVMRIGLLFAISWIMGLERILFHMPVLTGADGQAIGISGKDLVLLIGGLFLITKATIEIHHKVEGGGVEGAAIDASSRRAAKSITSAIVQILLLDLVFSLDSVITAVGMTDQMWVMITAVVISVGMMLMFAGQVGRFVTRHPTLKMLGLAFLVLIGVMLVADAFHQRMPHGYVYFAMAFALGVEVLNIRSGGRGKVKPAPVAASG